MGERIMGARRDWEGGIVENSKLTRSIISLWSRGRFLLRE
jgi:hypothetical protein